MKKIYTIILTICTLLQITTIAYADLVAIPPETMLEEYKASSLNLLDLMYNFPGIKYLEEEIHTLYEKYDDESFYINIYCDGIDGHVNGYDIPYGIKIVKLKNDVPDIIDGEITINNKYTDEDESETNINYETLNIDALSFIWLDPYGVGWIYNSDTSNFDTGFWVCTDDLRLVISEIIHTDDKDKKEREVDYSLFKQSDLDSLHIKTGQSQSKQNGESSARTMGEYQLNLFNRRVLMMPEHLGDTEYEILKNDITDYKIVIGYNFNIEDIENIPGQSIASTKVSSSTGFIYLIVFIIIGLLVILIRIKRYKAEVVKNELDRIRNKEIKREDN